MWRLAKPRNELPTKSNEPNTAFWVKSLNCDSLLVFHLSLNFKVISHGDQQLMLSWPSSVLFCIVWYTAQFLSTGEFSIQLVGFVQKLVWYFILILLCFSSAFWSIAFHYYVAISAACSIFNCYEITYSFFQISKKVQGRSYFNNKL